MPRATSPPSLPTDLVDGLLDGLRRVAAVADLIETVGGCVPSDRLLDGTLTEVGGIIGGEVARMLALVRSYKPTPPAP